MYCIEDFQSITNLENVIITQHSRKRFQERGITIDDVMQVFRHGDIIEQYPDDYPFSSCLILLNDEKIIHVVASIDEGIIYVITAYVPDPEKWENDWKTRKEEQ